jgi:hypothetical protein
MVPVLQAAQEGPAMPTDVALSVQAAISLARALRRRGLVASRLARTDGAVHVLLFSRSTGPLAGQSYVITQDGTLWFNWPGEPPCPACPVSDHVVAFEISGDCMTGDGINDGDIVIVDRTSRPCTAISLSPSSEWKSDPDDAQAAGAQRRNSPGPVQPAYQPITITHEAGLSIVGRVILTYRPHG